MYAIMLFRMIFLNYNYLIYITYIYYIVNHEATKRDTKKSVSLAFES